MHFTNFIFRLVFTAVDSQGFNLTEDKRFNLKKDQSLPGVIVKDGVQFINTKIYWDKVTDGMDVPLVCFYEVAPATDWNSI